MSVNTKVNGQLVKSAGLYKASVPIQSGDIYSFEERQVGVFADGKPLYQKTINCSTLPNNTTKEIEHGISNIDDVANIFVIAKNPTSGVWQNVPTVNTTNLNQQIQAWISGTKVHIRSAIDYSAYTSCYVTIQYTKTTDVAGSGEYVPSGDKAVHYDDTEQVIGTWLGETLYRKTFDVGALPNNTTKNVAHGLNYGFVVSLTGSAIRSTDKSVIALPNINTTGIANCCQLTMTDTNFVLRSGTDMSLFSGYVTVEYTKTS